MAEQTTPRPRPSIAERAARRDRTQADPKRDRYSTLVRALQAGRELPIERGRRTTFEWHPVLWTLLRVALFGAVVYVVTIFVHGLWWDAKVDTWSGPDTTVTSGQRLPGCDAANAHHDTRFPTWVRYRGAVFVMTDGIFPVRNQGAPNRTQFVESGYALDGIRMLLTKAPAASPPELVILTAPPALAGRVYEHEAGCA